MNPETMKCPKCGEQILIADYEASRVTGPDPTPAMIAKVFPDGYFSSDAPANTVKTENRTGRVLRRFRNGVRS